MIFVNNLLFRKSKKSIYIFDWINYKNGLIFDISVILICCLSFGFSWIESSVTLDSHHWGFMYVPALDLKRGLIPHKDTLIAYGYLTSWIQSLSLTLFGERLKSIGIMTGIFYSLSIFLSYIIFLKFIPKYLAFFSTSLIFLIHPYITSPWSNYYGYTFQLVSLVLLISKGRNGINSFFSGLFLGLSFLCRYSAIIGILPPIIIFLCYEFFSLKDSRKVILKRIIYFSLGFLLPIILFLVFLTSHLALSSFFIQNRAIVKTMGRGANLSTFIEFLLNLLTFKTNRNIRDLRTFLFTVVFFCNLASLLFIFYKASIKKQQLSHENFIIIAICLTTLFGYLNSIHLYAIFRLINSSSLGFGIIIYSIFNLSNPIPKPIKIFSYLPLIIICFILSNSLIFTKNSSTLFPWKIDRFTGKGVVSNNIKLFQGMILSQSYHDFYQEIYYKILPFKNFYIVNWTQDPVAIALNDLPRVQVSPFFIPELEQNQKVEQVINLKKAVILSDKNSSINGYKVIFNKPWPLDIPWMGGRGVLYISVPEEVAQKSL